MAKLYFSYSAMNAGKSTILLQSAHNYVERGMRTMLFTSSHHEGPDEGQIRSRLGLSVKAHVFREGDDLFAVVGAAHAAEKLDCIFVDEAQFLTPDQVWQLARVADRLRIPVLCYGLRTDFRGELFAGAAQLLAIADSLREIRTICHCGAKATMVVRRGLDGLAAREGDQVGVERDDYVSLCRKHWEDEMGRWPAEDGAKASAEKLIPLPRGTSSQRQETP